MKKVKINKALISSLIVTSLLMTSITIQQSIASDGYVGSWSTDIVELTDSDTYSEEVDLTSAPEYSENIVKMKSKYENIFEDKLKEKLKNTKNEHLDTFIERIDELIEKIKEKESMNLEEKEKILAQLLALKKVIQDIAEDNIEYSIDIDLEEILKI